MKTDRITGTLHEDQCIFLIISRSVFLRVRNVSVKVVEKFETHILFSITFSWKQSRLWDKIEKYWRAGKDTDDNMAREHCMLDILGYRYTHRICNTYCFATAGIVARTPFSVTLCLHYLSSFNLHVLNATYHPLVYAVYVILWAKIQIQ